MNEERIAALEQEIMQLRAELGGLRAVLKDVIYDERCKQMVNARPAAALSDC